MDEGRTMAGLLEERVRADIVEGDLTPGSRLTLNGLGARYNAGLIPLREALARLTNKGFVTSEQNKGFRVTPVSREDLLDLNATRVGIETMALRRAVERGGVEWEARLLAASHRLDRTQTYADADKRRVTPEWDRAHEEFHHALVASCDSPRLIQYRSELAEQVRRYRCLSISYAATPRKVDDEHRVIVAAALDRDPDALCTLMAAHFEKTVEIILRSSALSEATS